MWCGWVIGWMESALNQTPPMTESNSSSVSGWCCGSFYLLRMINECDIRGLDEDDWMIHCYYGFSTQPLLCGCRRCCCCFPGKQNSLSLCHMDLMSLSCFHRYLRFAVQNKNTLHFAPQSEIMSVTRQHTMCRRRAANAILSYLFITPELLGGARQGWGDRPLPHLFGASARPNGAKTKDCGRQQKRAAEGRGRIPAACAAKRRHQGGNGPCVFRAFSCERANNWFTLQQGWQLDAGNGNYSESERCFWRAGITMNGCCKRIQTKSSPEVCLSKWHCDIFTDKWKLVLDFQSNWATLHHWMDLCY